LPDETAGSFGFQLGVPFNRKIKTDE
jgi:hypothetical protein